jgi:hypothetical protein
MQGMPMADSNDYIAYAQHCLAIARTVNGREARVVLRKMAAEWTKLASAFDLPARAESKRGGIGVSGRT